MKKIIIALFVLFLGLQVNAATTTTTSSKWNQAAMQKKLNNIAYVLIKKNNLPTGITIKASPEANANAYSNINKEIYVYKGLLDLTSDDAELAAVLSHEMGHIINGHCAKQTILNSVIANMAGFVKTETAGQAIGVAAAQQISTTKLSRKDEFEADITAIDLMVNAGYNPLAMVSLLNKMNDGSNFDLIATHPSSEKRIMNAYDYIAYTYPTLAKKGYNSTAYNNAYKLISLNIEERNASPKLMKKYQKEQQKLKKDKIKRAKKMLKAGNAWTTSYAVINAMNQEQSQTQSTTNAQPTQAEK